MQDGEQAYPLTARPSLPPVFFLLFPKRADLKNFVDYLEEAYCCFLEGDDEAHQAITTEFSEARDGEDAGAEDFLRKLEKNNESLAQTNQEVSCIRSLFTCGWVKVCVDAHVRYYRVVATR